VQIKVFSQLVKKCHQLGYLVPTLADAEPGEETFVGATVLPPKKGAYFEPIMALDFASLYPR